MREMLAALGGKATGFHLATYKTDGAKQVNSRYVLHFLVNPHLSRVKYNFVQSAILLLRIRPRVIITTGAGIAIPIASLGKCLGVKLVMVDTMALVDRLSRTGEFLYKYADLFIVQWETLTQRYPKAIYGGMAI